MLISYTFYIKLAVLKEWKQEIENYGSIDHYVLQNWFSERLSKSHEICLWKRWLGITWFKINSMKANPEKFQFMTLSKSRPPEYNLLIGSNVIKESADLELLELIIDSKLSFEKRISKLCQTTSFKLHALRRIRKYLTLEKIRVLGNAFVNCQFKYAPLVWMFCQKTISKYRKFTIKHWELFISPMTPTKIYLI